MHITEISKIYKEEVTKAFEFFMKELKLEPYRELITAELALPDQLPKHCNGNCQCSINAKTKEIDWIKIKIRQTTTAYGVVECLAHEMIHAKQFTERRLEIQREPRKLFGFIPFGSHVVQYFKGQRITGMPYDQMPSELEAFEQQIKLCKRYIKYDIVYSSDD